jgi:hypothetical protein
MRNVSVSPASSGPASVPPRNWSASPAALVCGALLLALVYLAFQIASVL